MAELIAAILLVAGALYLGLKPGFQPRVAGVGEGGGGSAAGGSRRRRASAPAAAPRSSATRGTVTPAARGSRPDLTPLTSFLPGRLYRSTGSSDPCFREETLSHAQHVPTHRGRGARRGLGDGLQ